VYVADIASKKEQLITDDTLHNFYPTWTIDGNILYTCREKSEDGILNTILCVIDASGKNKRPLNLIAWNGRFSPDRKEIAYVKNFEDHEGSELFIADADGKNVRQLTGE
jgi:Tol biopolymer transport system component